MIIRLWLFAAGALFFLLCSLTEDVRYSRLLPLNISLDSAERLIASWGFTRNTLPGGGYAGSLDGSPAEIRFGYTENQKLESYAVAWEIRDSVELLRRYDWALKTLKEELGEADSTNNKLKIGRSHGSTKVWFPEGPDKLTRTLDMTFSSRLSLGFVLIGAKRSE